MRKAIKVMCGVLLACAATAILAATADSGNTLRRYNGTDAIGETTLADFEQASGIKVIHDTFDGEETVDGEEAVQTKLLTGRSGYGRVMLNASLGVLLIKAGVFQPLDKHPLPSLSTG